MIPTPKKIKVYKIKKTIKQIFVEFLKSEGCFDDYIKNWKDSFDNVSFNKPIKYKENYFESAFLWCKNKNQLGFWSDINKKWQLIISNVDKYNNVYKYQTRCTNCGKFIDKKIWIKKKDLDLCQANCQRCFLVCY